MLFLPQIGKQNWVAFTLAEFATLLLLKNHAMFHVLAPREANRIKHTSLLHYDSFAVQAQSILGIIYLLSERIKR